MFAGDSNNRIDQHQKQLSSGLNKICSQAFEKPASFSNGYTECRPKVFHHVLGNGGFPVAVVVDSVKAVL